MTRGIAPSASAPERPGAITVLRYRAGVLTKDRSIAPGGGYGFQSRNIDFHPTRPWVYLVLERQNALQLFARRSDGSLPDAPLFSVSTLDDSALASASQLAAAVAVHPNGRFVYVANRASSTRDRAGTPVFAGGVNSIAVFALDRSTGEPTRIANAATQGFSPRTFALDARGGLLVAGNSAVINVLDGAEVRTVPASLAAFHVGADGKLVLAHKYDMDLLPRRTLMWVGLVDLP